jgi:O-antigen/teichoic acid export membrane protein
VLSSFRWLAAGKFLGQLINWAITLVVIRLLTPADYGLMEMANLFIAILTLLNEMGLGTAIIQAEEIEQDSLQQIFGMIILINAGLFFLLFLASPLVALFFGEPQLIPIVRLLAVQFLFIGLSIVPQSLLERDMRFKERSIVDFVSNLVGGFITLGLAVTGYGVWALVWGSIILFLTKTIGLHLFSPFLQRPSFSFKGMRHFISFGGYIMATRVIWYLYSQADVFIIGKILGKELLGLYAVGKHVAQLPSLKISPIVNQVVLPSFSRIQKDLEQVAYYLQKGIRILSFFAFPVFWGISSIAPELVAVVLGERWMPASKTLIWMSFILPLVMISGIIQAALMGVGKPSISLKNIIFAFILMPAAFFIGCQWGILGVSLAWTFAFPIYFIFMITNSARFIGLHHAYDVIKAMIKPGLSGFIMYLAVVTTKFFLQGTLPQVIELFIFVTIGAGVYMGLLFHTDKESFQEVLKLVRK